MILQTVNFMSECGRPDCLITDLHTHQAGTDGIIGHVCEHGSLARQCHICELESENSDLRNILEMCARQLEVHNEKLGCITNASSLERYNERAKKIIALAEEALRQR